MRHNRLRISRSRSNTSIVVFALLFITSSTVLRLVIQAEKLFSTYDKIHETRVYSIILPLDNRTLGPPRACEAPPCLEVLSVTDSRKYSSCTTSAAKRRGKVELSACAFSPQSGRAPVPLASFPGSGNTWVRGLLQQATGLCTGSLYCDRDLRSRGFPGEGLTSDSVLVVKTHKAAPFTIDGDTPLVGSKAVLIIRNPFDALVSERNRQVVWQVNGRISAHMNSSHVQLAGKEYFGEETSSVLPFTTISFLVNIQSL